MTKFDLTNESQMSQQTKVQAEGWKVKLIASQCYKHNVHQLKVYFFKSKFSIFCPMCGFVCILRHRVDIWCLLQWPEKLNMNQLNHLHLIFDYIFIKNYSILISCIMGQRESFFQSRDENESFSYSVSHIETRPRISDTWSQALRRDREKISSNLGHRDEIEIYYLHSQASRREREFPWCDLGFWDENENSKSCHLSLNSGFNGLTILHAIFWRLKLYMHGSTFYFMFSHFEGTQSFSPCAYVVIF